jgi:putrescine transport system substrate-binding protein
VNADVKNNPGIFPTPEVMPKLVPDLPESPEFTRALTRTWTKFRTGK